jgi:Zn-dependent protease
MRWSLKIVTIRQIPIRIHATFWLLFALIAYDPNSAYRIDWRGAAMVAAVFACVLLHELGHSLMAQRFGVKVDAITLLPIGGVASMRTMPHKPAVEFLVAVAGPVVSLVLAVIFAMPMLLDSGTTALTALLHRPWSAGTPLLFELARINVLLAAFNLLPAFPMDGGRILRSILWPRIGFFRATSWATQLGRCLAIACFVYALISHNISLTIISLFVYMGAEAESQAVRWQGMLTQLTAGDVMDTELCRLNENSSIALAAKEVMTTQPTVFPVYRDDRLVGLIDRATLEHAQRSQRSADPVARWMTRRIQFCTPTDPLTLVFDALFNKHLEFIAVLDNDQLAGLITPAQLGKLKRSDGPGGRV